MRKALILLSFAAFAVTTGCVQRWAKPGASESDFAAARIRCDALAYRSLPPDMRWMLISPGYVTPGGTQCWKSRGQRRCDYTPSRYVPPRYGMVDGNDRARDHRSDLCLAEDGWRPVD